MSYDEQYYILKNRSLAAYKNYIEVLKQTNLDDLNTTQARLPLLNAYIEIAKANADMSEFINTFKRKQRDSA